MKCLFLARHLLAYLVSVLGLLAWPHSRKSSISSTAGPAILSGDEFHQRMWVSSFCCRLWNNMAYGFQPCQPHRCHPQHRRWPGMSFSGSCSQHQHYIFVFKYKFPDTIISGAVTSYSLITSILRLISTNFVEFANKSTYWSIQQLVRFSVLLINLGCWCLNGEIVKLP